jgi:hypothetical protein
VTGREGWPGVEMFSAAEGKAWESGENVGAPTFKVLLEG